MVKKNITYVFHIFKILMNNIYQSSQFWRNVHKKQYIIVFRNLLGDKIQLHKYNFYLKYKVLQ